MRIPVAYHSYRHESLPVAAQRVINWYAEQQPADAKAQVILRPTPGLVPFAAAPNGPIRGMHAMGDRQFVVAQINVYRIDANGTTTNLGTIDAGGAVSMSDNGTQVIIVVPETRAAWVATLTGGGLTEITHSDFDGAVAVDVLDGFAAFVKPDSTQFFLSQPNDALTFDALDFASAEGSPDNIVTLKRVARELWIFGERTTEIWSNIGDADFPFRRVSGAFIERGCAAAFSVAAAFGTVFWLGNDRVVYGGNGFRPERISTHAIEQQIRKFTNVSTARGWAYEQEGHQFYILTFPQGKRTYVFDRTTGVWHERESEGYAGWRCITGIDWAGGTFAGDANSGQVWRIDPQARSEDGTLIRRVAVGVPLHSEGRRLFFSRLELDMETGVGGLALVVSPILDLANDPVLDLNGNPILDLATADTASDPVVWLKYSDDSGQTWSRGMFRCIGPLGQYRRRIDWRPLGAARNRVFSVGMADAIGTALIAFNADVQAGVG